MDKIKHLENKYSIARYELLTTCDSDELKFYLYLKLYAINKHEAFPTYSTIKETLGWENKKINRVIHKMVNKGRLKIGKKEAETKGGKQIINIYDITWYDRINNNDKLDEEEVVANDTTLSLKGSGKMEPKGSGKMELEQLEINITNRNRERTNPLTPADEMRLFINSEEYFNNILEEISQRTNIPEGAIRSELLKFKSYWTELNKSGTKQRWEMEKTFELKRRIATWFSKVIQFNQRSTPKGKTIYNTLI